MSRTNDQIRADQMRNIKNEIRTSFEYLKSDTMNFIAELINKHSPQYKFQHTINTSKYLDRIVPIHDRNDIQFLFQNGATAEDVGHWICVKYDHTVNKVEVYDSLNQNFVPKENERAIERLYPKISIFKDIIFKKVKYTQSNGSACGVYACTFAITLVFDKDPSQLDYQINMQPGKDESEYLRTKLLEIIDKDELSEFSTQ